MLIIIMQLALAAENFKRFINFGNEHVANVKAVEWLVEKFEGYNEG
jgi:hypothetical protein